MNAEERAIRRQFKVRPKSAISSPRMQ